MMLNDENYDKKKFELIFKYNNSKLHQEIEKCSNIEDPSIFFQFNCNFIGIKNSLNETFMLSFDEFKKYECTKNDEEEYEIKFNSIHFKILLGDIDEDQIITLSVYEKNYKKMEIFYENEKEGKTVVSKIRIE